MILRTKLGLIGLLVMLLGQMALTEDYGDDTNAAAGADGGVQSSDDIFDPAQLEQEVEAQQQRNSLEDENDGLHMQTDNSLSAEQAVMTTTVKPALTEPPALARDDHDESTAAEMEDAATQRQDTKVEHADKHSHDYYYDMPDEENHKVLPKKPTTTTTPMPKPITTMIPEYVRKAKAERYPENNSNRKKPIEMDNSDYMDDEGAEVAVARTPASVEYDQHSMQMDEQQPSPLAQHQQQQQLPARGKPKSFKPKPSDEYYYDDQSERDEPKLVSMTTAPAPASTIYSADTTAVTTSTTTLSPVTVELPLLQSRFSLHPLSWGGSISSSSSSSSSTVAPTTTPASTTISGSSTNTLAPTTVAPGSSTTPRKQPKHINVSSPKPELLPADQLRNYIKDVYIRMPLAVIVDPSAASLDKAKTLFIDALQDKNINIKIVLVTLNAAGAPSAFSFNNTREFIAGLNSTKEHEGGDSFVGVLHAAELVPYDSAVFISTARVPPHTELVQDAAITLLKKRIRLFMLWFGERAASENETEEAVGGILGEVAIRSGGEIIHIISTEHGQHIAGNTLTLVADGYRGAQELEVPVDTTLSSLHVKIDAPMRRATLETPNGEINLKKLVKFKLRDPVANDTRYAEPDELDAYVPLNKLRKATKLTLKLSPEQATKAYNVFIRAERKADVFLSDIIKRFDSYNWNGHDLYPIRLKENRMSTPRKPKLTHAKLKFPETRKDTDNEDQNKEMKNTLPKGDVEVFSETELHSKTKSTPSMNQTEFAAVTSGQQRSTLNSMLQQRCGTKIELSTQSQLLVSAGQTAQLLYEVTNMRAERVYQNVQVTDERRFLVQLTPSSFYLGPRETTTVRLTVLVPTGTAQGTTDRITFNSYGRETATLALNLKVTSSIEAQDITGPSLSWEFGNRCEYVAADSLNCGERFWTLDITAQDWQSGMLRLQTTPSEGLFYRNYYTAGTTEPLKATYMASCCEPKVSIAAHDAAGNQRSISIDVRDIVLTDAAIAAIVLGSILLILLIAAIIASIVWCCRRRKVSLELPTYRSHSTRSME